MKENTLTVRQLIALLQKAPPDLPVWHEGCDCDGNAFNVLNQGNRVYITRSDYRNPDEFGMYLEDPT